MDIRKIKKLIEMLQESDLKEIEVSQGDESVRILRDNNSDKTTALLPSLEKVPEASLLKPSENQIGNIVTSPIVGTFYRKPSPDKDPFVRVGDVVSQGDVLCIVEAMKMMNEIKSEYSGRIISIDLEDGQPVEFGQKIITID
jgi:acetyl-CoA carboxylase biotin carboxyl carrier protein|tara:strand:- start:11868 stop:12293 length:426 start_codon:yes stop_codon:yes gene_type:complete